MNTPIGIGPQSLVPSDLPIPAAGAAPASGSRADAVYARLKQDLFEFRLMPGDRFTETEMADRLGLSRTPVREALFRLQREGLVRVHFRSGWEVMPLDFTLFDELYDIRKLFEATAVQRLASGTEDGIDRTLIPALESVWLVPKAQRCIDPREVALLDEAFHATLVQAAGNSAMVGMHRDITERIRIVRRLDFTYEDRVHATYDEHAAILQAVLRRRSDQAMLLIRSHISVSQHEVRKISLHRLHALRTDGVR